MSVTQDLWSDLPIHPGETLADLLDERGTSQAELAKRMGRPAQVINQIVRGKKSVTAATAIGLERALGLPAEFWVNLQSIYDLTCAKLAAAAPAEPATVDLDEPYPPARSSWEAGLVLAEDAPEFGEGDEGDESGG